MSFHRKLQPGTLIDVDGIVYSCSLIEREDDRSHDEYWEVQLRDMSRALQRSEEHNAWLRARDNQSGSDEPTQSFTNGQHVMALYFANSRYYAATIVSPCDGDAGMYRVTWADGDANYREVSVADIRPHS